MEPSRSHAVSHRVAKTKNVATPMFRADDTLGSVLTCFLLSTPSVSTFLSICLVQCFVFLFAFMSFSCKFFFSLKYNFYDYGYYGEKVLCENYILEMVVPWMLVSLLMNLLNILNMMSKHIHKGFLFTS